MANAKSEYGLALIVVGLGVNNFNSKKPMINSTLNGNAYIVRTNTYDANGYVTHSEVTGDGPEEISFTYTSL